ncbi:hypothetical protein PR003_g10128 [Phytophthora rubi]|uniref:Uncharacterized protein n=1 Tax=Phytophthora rubi TaxID=129364 RepID=A0A6A3LUP0_9STRA|nr:hypothetical protein PR002_g14445 [Phytophthora rubi]KAE9019984.1 hypothetical protein PR001_g13730 [Phytophthora rubi]KAE9341154.1 hypothetical protein PR003_g10128 [Phytophthora rubi]
MQVTKCNRYLMFIFLVVPSVTKCTYSPNRINSRYAICGAHETKVYKLQVQPFNILKNQS